MVLSVDRRSENAVRDHDSFDGLRSRTLHARADRDQIDDHDRLSGEFVNAEVQAYRLGAGGGRG
jgi:hypothetical protein